VSGKKRFFASHAKSSAAVISLGIHAVLLVVALSFVAVTVITKEDSAFETKQVKRPKMPIRKLQVPVNVKKKKIQKPKLRKRIVVNPKLNQNMPDIKMPEITGVKGGMGGAGGDGLGGAGGVGFSMPEIEIFGIKSRGEKVFLILDASEDMMYDEMGGIPAYTIIKEEMIRVVGGLGATALFNVAVYQTGTTFVLFPKLVSANSVNVAKVEAWLRPLNATKAGMGSKDVGVKTLGPGGQPRSDDMRVGKFAKAIGTGQDRWFRPAMIAMQQQADAVFLFTNTWGLQRTAKEDPKLPKYQKWYDTGAGRKWMESYAEAKRLHAEENRKRAAAGEPPRVIRDTEWQYNGIYFPDIERPPQPDWYYYTGRDFVEGFLLTREQYKTSEVQSKSGLKKKRSKVDFSFNVVQFLRTDGEGDWYDTTERFKKLSGLCSGQHNSVSGLEAIQGYVK
jgi:hypothetical protein